MVVMFFTFWNRKYDRSKLQYFNCVDSYKVKLRGTSAQFSTIKVDEYSRTCIMDCLFFYNLR